MAHELFIQYTTGQTLYAVLRNNATGQAFNTSSGGSLETFSSSNWASKYAIALTEIGSCGIYDATLTPIPADAAYDVLLFLQAGGSAAIGDSLISQGQLWVLSGAVVGREVNVTQLLGTAWAAPAVAGTPDANVISFSTAAATAIAAAVWGAATATYAGAGTFGLLIGGVVASVWSYATRILTAGTNIVLAKGTGLTGFNDPSAAANATAVWTDTTSSDFTQAGSPGKTIATFLFDSSGFVKSSLQSILGTALTESVTGYLAAAFKKLFNVATPVLTAASVNQTGDVFGSLPANFTTLVISGSGVVSADAATFAGGTAFVHTGGKLWVLDGSGNAIATATAVAAIPTNPYTGTPPTAAQIRTEIDDNSTQLTLLVEIAEADRFIDTTADPTQYHEVFCIAGTNTQLFVKKLTDISGSKLNSTSTVVGGAKQ